VTRLDSYLKDADFTELFQSAYKAGHSTETALIRFRMTFSVLLMANASYLRCLIFQLPLIPLIINLTGQTSPSFWNKR